MQWARYSSFLAALTGTLVLAVTAAAQNVVQPEVGYIFPPGGLAGTTVNVRLGVYDATADLQFFVLDRRVKLVQLGPPGKLLMQGPPFFSGQRAYNPLPLPREIPARLVIPPDLPPGPIRWQLANANGTSSTGVLIVGNGPQVVENEKRRGDQQLAAIPVTIAGRLINNGEVDRYTFRPSRAGVVTCELTARRLGSNFFGVLKVLNSDGELIAETTDTEGLDTSFTFAVQANRAYTVSVRDLEGRGHRSYVYLLKINAGPHVLAAIPASGRRGQTRPVKFIGLGITTGKAKVESVTRIVAFPPDRDQDSFVYRLETPSGHAADFRLKISDLEETVEPARPSGDVLRLAAPVAVTGVLDARGQQDRYRFKGTKGDVWSISLDAQKIGSPLDVVLTVYGPGGESLAENDDLAGTTDAGLQFSVPADGAYDLVVGDMSGSSGSAVAIYRLAIERPRADFELDVAQRLNVLIGGKAELTVKVTRKGLINGPIQLAIHGFPKGVHVKEGVDLVIPPDQTSVKIPLQSDNDAPSTASLVTITGTAKVGEKTLCRTATALAAGNLAPRSLAENRASAVLVASTMKPVCKIWPAESDERTVHRGSTHLAEILLERLEGYQGEFLIQMNSRQPAKFRQGCLGPHVIMPAGQESVYYPWFLPEGLETEDAYRISLKAVAKVADPQGKVHDLVTTFANTVSNAITIEGALLHIEHGALNLNFKTGESVEIPITIFRSPKLTGPVRLELYAAEELAEVLDVKPVLAPLNRRQAFLPVTFPTDTRFAGRHHLTIRATVLLKSKLLPTISETSKNSPLDDEMLFHLGAGLLPVVAQTDLPIVLSAGNGD